MAYVESISPKKPQIFTSWLFEKKKTFWFENSDWSENSGRLWRISKRRETRSGLERPPGCCAERSCGRGRAKDRVGGGKCIDLGEKLGGWNETVAVGMERKGWFGEIPEKTCRKAGVCREEARKLRTYWKMLYFSADKWLQVLDVSISVTSALCSVTPTRGLCSEPNSFKSSAGISKRNLEMSYKVVLSFHLLLLN